MKALYTIPAVLYLLTIPIGISWLLKRDADLFTMYMLMFWFFGWAVVAWWSIGHLIGAL